MCCVWDRVGDCQGCLLPGDSEAGGTSLTVNVQLSISDLVNLCTTIRVGLFSNKLITDMSHFG
jgi:hypothetical protein